MPTAEHYRRSAEECRSLADLAQDETERDSLLAMARQWERLAEHKAKIEARQGPQSSN
jgi:hypothetical protein